ncbi:MAG: hypothetical protein JWP86_1808 [Phenylobacterium sp.]|nr:hypothetical protein [Phenylobacterium sp.]
MSKITALSIQTTERPTTVRAATPVAAQTDDAQRVVSTPTPPAPPAKIPAPQVQPVASSALAVLIQAQSEVEKVAPKADPKAQDASDKAAKPAVDPQPTHGEDDQHGHNPPVVLPPVTLPPVTLPPVTPPHVDPQPTHGEDDDHGHKPPVIDPPPVVQPPIVQPPVVQPPVVKPPVVQPPLVQPPVRRPPPLDSALPAKAAALVARQLADEAASERGRSAFAAAAAASQAQRTVIQGQVAMTILQSVQADMAAFQAAGSNATWSRRGLYA